ncbi:MAG: hypothetical protein DRQ37_06970 [Gammaproteobacteria bacterium]|nr:MAG: hypothetical protein DRQ37_06970 [Gammaproteobacteria bacterium]
MQVTFDGSICQHAGECVKGSPEVFQVIDENLVIDTSKDTEEAIRATVSKCPSGALKVVD